MIIPLINLISIFMDLLSFLIAWGLSFCVPRGLKGLTDMVRTLIYSSLMIIVQL